MTNEPRQYEGLFLFPPSASANLDDALGTVRGYVEKHGGKLHVLKKWDDRKLAYEVKKQTRGVYVLSFFEAPPVAIDAINREVNLGDAVLRCLLTDASHLSAGEVESMQPQKPAPRKRDDDDDAGPRPPRRDTKSLSKPEADPNSNDALDDDQVTPDREAAPEPTAR